MKVNVPSTPTPNTTTYDKLKGVDYSVDASQVDKRRTPDGTNFIPDIGGNPEKRKGWAVLHTAASEFDNLWSFSVGAERYNLCTFGTTLREFTDSTFTNTNDFTLTSAGKKIGLYSQSPTDTGFYIFDEDKIVKATPVGGVLNFAEITYYAPLVIIARDPRTGGGTLYENINKMTRQRKETFLNSPAIVGSSWSAVAATDTLTSATAHTLEVDDPVIVDVGTGALPGGIEVSKTYYVKTKTATDITISETVGGATVDITSTGTAGFFVKTYSYTFLTTSLIDTTDAVNKPYTATYTDLTGVHTATISSATGATITLSKRYAPIGSEDNIEITYYATGTNTNEQICKCRSWARYNPRAVDQIFVTSCDLAGYGQYVFYSDSGDISYWPDQNYVYIGGSGTTIKGFLNVGESLAVIKEDNSNEATIFFLYQTTIKVNNPDGTTSEIDTFASKQTSAGVGAVGNAMGVLGDEPLFLSSTGIYGITSVNYSSEKIVRNRSKFVNSKLTAEANLHNARSIVWKDYFMVFVNSHVYILDGKQKFSDSKLGTYVYECYYWNNVPATEIMTFDDELYFSGTVDGDNSLCKFKLSESSSSYSDNGVAITATWATPYDNDNGTQFFKTMQKKGTLCTVKPYSASSVNIYISKDGGTRELITTATVTAGGFSGMSFSNGSFSGSLYPRDVFFAKKEKKYKRLQIILENSTIGEGFGVVEIVKSWFATRYAK